MTSPGDMFLAKGLIFAKEQASEIVHETVPAICVHALDPVLFNVQGAMVNDPSCVSSPGAHVCSHHP